MPAYLAGVGTTAAPEGGDRGPKGAGERGRQGGLLGALPSGQA